MMPNFYFQRRNIVLSLGDIIVNFNHNIMHELSTPNRTIAFNDQIFQTVQR